MSDPILKQQDIKLLLKATIDYNSFVLAIVAQVINNEVKAVHVVRELKRGEKHYKNAINSIVKKYEPES